MNTNLNLIEKSRGSIYFFNYTLNLNFNLSKKIKMNELSLVKFHRAHFHEATCLA